MLQIIWHQSTVQFTCSFRWCRWAFPHIWRQTISCLETFQLREPSYKGTPSCLRAPIYIGILRILHAGGNGDWPKNLGTLLTYLKKPGNFTNPPFGPLPFMCYLFPILPLKCSCVEGDLVNLVFLVYNARLSLKPPILHILFPIRSVVQTRWELKTKRVKNFFSREQTAQIFSFLVIFYCFMKEEKVCKDDSFHLSEKKKNLKCLPLCAGFFMKYTFCLGFV